MVEGSKLGEDDGADDEHPTEHQKVPGLVRMMIQLMEYPKEQQKGGFNGEAAESSLEGKLNGAEDGC